MLGSGAGLGGKQPFGCLGQEVLVKAVTSGGPELQGNGIAGAGEGYQVLLADGERCLIAVSGRQLLYRECGRRLRYRGAVGLVGNGRAGPDDGVVCLPRPGLGQPGIRRTRRCCQRRPCRQSAP